VFDHLAEARLEDAAPRIDPSWPSPQVKAGLRPEPFDPNAVDGDGDGIVQDGTPFERPSVIGAASRAAERALREASQRRG